MCPRTHGSAVIFIGHAFSPPDSGRPRAFYHISPDLCNNSVDFAYRAAAAEGAQFLHADAGAQSAAFGGYKKSTLFRYRVLFDCQKSGKATFLKRLRPAAAQSLCAVGAQFPRLQAEMCFLRRTCRRRKQSILYLRLRRRASPLGRAQTLRDFFDKLKKSALFRYRVLFVYFSYSPVSWSGTAAHRGWRWSLSAA